MLPNKGYALGFEFAEKQRLLEMLADPEGVEFSRCVTEQLEYLAELTPTLDRLLTPKAKAAKGETEFDIEVND